MDSHVCFDFFYFVLFSGFDCENRIFVVVFEFNERILYRKLLARDIIKVVIVTTYCYYNEGKSLIAFDYTGPPGT